jgi:hypothetical protein
LGKKIKVGEMKERMERHGRERRREVGLVCSNERKEGGK